TIRGLLGSSFEGERDPGSRLLTISITSPPSPPAPTGLTSQLHPLRHHHHLAKQLARRRRRRRRRRSTTWPPLHLQAMGLRTVPFPAFRPLGSPSSCRVHLFV